MAYRKDKTTVAQTAANDAAQMVSALIAAGIIDNVEGAGNAFASLQSTIFEQLTPVVDGDNALFEKVEAENPAPAKSSGGGKGGGSKLDAAAARATVLNFGRFKDLTLAQVEALAPGEGKAEGYNDKDGAPKSGLAYIEWLSKSDTNEYMARRAKLILEDLKSGSADE